MIISFIEGKSYLTPITHDKVNSTPLNMNTGCAIFGIKNCNQK